MFTLVITCSLSRSSAVMSSSLKAVFTLNMSKRVSCVISFFTSSASRFILEWRLSLRVKVVSSTSSSRLKSYPVFREIRERSAQVTQNLLVPGLVISCNAYDTGLNLWCCQFKEFHVCKIHMSRSGIVCVVIDCEPWQHCSKRFCRSVWLQSLSALMKSSRLSTMSMYVDHILKFGLHSVSCQTSSDGITKFSSLILGLAFPSPDPVQSDITSNRVFFI